MLGSTLFASCACANIVAGQTVLRTLDSVRIRETEDVFLSKIGSVSAGPGKNLLVSDVSEGRVLAIKPDGTIGASYGKKGQGPGEFQLPGNAVTVGDSLFVIDNAQRRVSVFLLSSRKFVRSFTLQVPRADLMLLKGQLYAVSIDEKSFTPLGVIASDGKIVSREGVIPEFGVKNPMLVGPLGKVAVASRGNEMWSASELSQSLLAWNRGTTALSRELALPTSGRRGVSQAQYKQMLQDPQKAASLIYQHSTPVSLTLIAPDVLAFVSLDADMVKGNFVGDHYLSLVDVKQGKVCRDIKLPIPNDPLPRIVFTGDTMVVLQQGMDRNGEAASAIRRFRVEHAKCAWNSF